MMSSKRGFWFIVCSLSFTLPLHAADISAVGSWSTSLTSSDLAAGAGSDLRSPIESTAAQTALTITNTANSSWTVTVSNDTSMWPAGVSLAVRVASSGTGTGSVSSSGAYLILSGTARTLLSGSGDRADVQLQFRLNGVSVRNSFGNYSTSVIYSVQ